jgi:energy-coupling factor transporter ATP-binding protein EcfA2
VSLLRELKKQATLLVVSHDLADIAPLVDCAWRMQVSVGQHLEPHVVRLLLCALDYQAFARKG